MILNINTPVTESKIRELRIGDVVWLSGELVTARDRAHKRITEGVKLPVNFNVIYHCGPLVKKGKVISAGPTTSARMSKYTKIMAGLGTKIFIGKGGTNEEAIEIFREKGCAYLAFTGGAGVLAARAIKKIKAVYWSELGTSEAVWVLEVENFGPLVVAIDSHGATLYKNNYIRY